MNGLRRGLFTNAMATALPRASLQENGLNPAVALVGWLGAKPRHLRKLTEWYHSNGIATVTVIPPFRAMLIPALAQMNASKAIQELSKLRRPLFFHAFSGNGLFFLTQLFEHIRLTKTTSAAARVVNAMAAGCVIDSAPPLNDIATTTVRALTHVITSSIRPKGSLPLYRAPVVTGAARALVSCALMVPAVSAQVDVFQRVLQHDMLRVPYQFMYGPGDLLVPASDVEQYANALSLRGYRVRTKRFEESEHVAHYKVHPEIYTEELMRFYEECIRVKPAVVAT